MNIRALEYVISVDKNKSFVEAARECHVSQPALSMQIQKVEDIIGVKIFERGRRQIVTTSKGQEIVMYAKNILQSYRYLKGVKSHSSEVKIGLIHTIAPYLLPKIISGLQVKMEEIKMYFREGKTLELLGELDKGNMDCIIGAQIEKGDGYEKKYSFLSFHPLYDEEFFLCLPKGHPALASLPLTPASLKEVITNEIIIPMEEGHCLRKDISAICAFYNEGESNGENNFTATSIETIKQMIKLKNGIGLLPKLSIEKSDKELAYCRLPEKHVRKIGIFYRKNSSKISLIQEISKIIQPAVQALL